MSTRRKHLLSLSKAIASLADDKPLSEKRRQALACDLASLMRGELGAYVQCWLPADVVEYQPEGEPPLDEDEIETVLHRMGKYDDAAMEANANLLESLVNEVVSEREGGGS